MSKIRKLILGLTILVGMMITAVIGVVGVQNHQVSTAPIDAEVNNTSTIVENPKVITYSADQINIQKGGDVIDYTYLPSANSKASVTAYEYVFGNTMDRETGVNLKSIDATNVTVTYAYSTTKLIDADGVTSYTDFTCQKLANNGDKIYVYVLVTPTNETIPTTFTTSIVWYYGIPQETPIVNNADSTVTYKTLITGQEITKADLTIPTAPTGYYFDAFYADENYETLILEDEVKLGQKVYTRFANLPTDYLELDEENNSYYVKQCSDEYDELEGYLWYSGSLVSNPIQNLVIPAVYNNKNVTKIQSPGYNYETWHSESVFNECKSISLPCTLTQLGINTFNNCTSLTSIHIPNGITSIGSKTFNNCSSLEYINLPTSLVSIESYAFYDCSSIKSIILPNSLVNISEGAFYNLGIEACIKYDNAYYIGTASNPYKILIKASNNNISSVKLHPRVENIHYYAFNDIRTLVTANFSQCTNLTTIERGAFWSCGFTSIDLSNCTKLTTIGSNAFCGTGETSVVKLPNSIETLGNSAFQGCGANVGIDLFDLSHCTKLKVIPNGLFYYSGIKSIYLPDSIITIEGNPFSDSDLSYNKYDNLNYVGTKTNPYFVAVGVESTSVSEITLHADIKIFAVSLAQDSWRPNTTLTKIDCNNASLKIQSLSYCTALTTLTNITNITGIADSAFRGCTSLANLDLTNCTKLESIDSRAFYNCTSLTSIIIPANVTSIGEEVFYGCTGLTSLSVESGNPVYDSRDNCNAIIETATNKMIATCKNSTIPSGIEILEGDFTHLTGDIVLPSSLVVLNAQFGSGLTGVDFSNCTNLTTIGDYVFDQTSVSIIDLSACTSLTTIGSYAFSFNMSLETLILPSSVTRIGNYATEECYNLYNVIADTSGWYWTESYDNWINMTGGTSQTLSLGSNSYGYWYKK